MNQETINKVFIAFLSIFLVVDLVTFNVLSFITVPFYVFLIYVFGKQINLWGRLSYKARVKWAKMSNR